MANTVNLFESEHQGIIQDSQFDYYGKRLATAGSDAKISIFEINNENPKKVAEIFGNGHENSISSISWSHPRFGPLLASCGFDKKVIIWKESSPNIWNKLFEYTDHKNSVNIVSLAPHEYGLILICGSTDGYISLHEYKNEIWNSFKLFGHGFGVNGLSWGPSTYSENENLAPLRFVSCGNDNLIKIWQTKDNRIDSFHVVASQTHEDVVRDVQWRCINYYNYDIICSGGDDNLVNLWINKNNSSNEYENNECNLNNASEWKKFELRKFSSAISKLAWEENGNHLLVSTFDGTVFLFKELAEGTWDLISMSNSEGVMENVDGEGLETQEK